MSLTPRLLLLAEQGDAAQGTDQLGLGEQRALVVLGGDDLAVIGKIPLDQANKQRDRPALYHDVATLDGDGEHPVLFLDQLLELEHPFARQQDPFGEGKILGHGPLGPAEAVSVGRDHLELLVPRRFEENPVQVVLGLVGGNGEEGFLDHGLEGWGVQADQAFLGQLGHGRKFLGGEPNHLELGGARGDFQPMVVAALDGDLLGGNLTGDVVEVLGGYGDLAWMLHLGRQLHRDAHLEVGGADLELVLGTLQEGVAEDGLGGLFFDDVLGPVKTLLEFFPGDFDFHGELVPFSIPTAIL
ncbi:MAG: hypothetical protein UZ18_ATM001000161 [Armatimonadetes bacterium OLB18]|nr:MAG: hypothetical protein UZ18_ATM001000161 [Armatimonadetes bacterium OLB18]